VKNFLPEFDNSEYYKRLNGTESTLGLSQTNQGLSGSDHHIMKIDLDPSAFTSKDAYVRAALSKARDLAVQAWEDEHSERQSLIEREVAGLSKPELAKRLIKLLSRPNRARAQISDSMRNKAQAMRRKGAPVREIAAELGISIPSVYNITKD